MRNNKLTNRKVLQLFKDKGINKEDVIHNITAIKKAANEFSYPELVFNLVFFNIPFGNTHSYSFHTREGREYINSFKDYYFSYEQKENSIYKQLKNS